MNGALAGKVAFVAGASRGLGAAVATTLAQQGAAVAVAARSEREGRTPGTIHSVADRIADIGGRALAVHCDVTDENSVESAVHHTLAEFGGIDILISNAGMLWLGPIESAPLQSWQQCLDVNLTGVFLLTKAVIPHIRARSGGSLVAMTTNGVGPTVRGANAYWVAKAATERLYAGLTADLKPDNIAVYCLSLSRLVLTEDWITGRDSPGASARGAEALETIATGVALLAQQDSNGITGTIQHSDVLAAQRRHH
ncbi:SDR family NAD(P)-dependent oxidoreductase [Nocardia sp. NBC_01730]|uniref:SDR family NAD(P)-dependent oxidoreductase n=1 Tax=Nocardia sp. NBC_01730 TaxID=2975998 RepID=UPI002E1574A4|nr:SDR family NAD(P)-dependent oxidoreductase [Nocardia sp. NBC_01730]